jgi:homoserine O-acetyltransferase
MRNAKCGMGTGEGAGITPGGADSRDAGGKVGTAMSPRASSGKAPDSVGVVETKYFTFASPPGEMVLESGRKLGPVTLAHETYGKLSPAKDNAVLVLTALSGDAHAAGYHEGDEKPGWWDNMIGPGKGIDTDRWFVVCSNVIGGCMGSTGPSSINPATGRPYGLEFPMVTIGDMVEAERVLLDHLGIPRVKAAIGGSMGGMQVLQWAVRYPERVELAIPIATTARLSAQSIAFDEVGRQAIMADPEWRGGDYYGKGAPARGLSIARMVGHITYLSELSMHQKFGRRLQEKDEYGFEFGTDFQVESYLRHKGDSFVKRFDANSYLFLSKAMDYFDLGRQYGGALKEAFARAKSRFLVVSFSSDWLFPPSASLDIVTALHQNSVPVVYTEIKSDYGHDAFLLEVEDLSALIRNTLDRAEPPRASVALPGLPLPEGALNPEDRVVVELVEEGSRVLDLGCGEGDLLKALKDFKRVRAEGIELDEACIQACVRKGLANVHHGDLDEGLSGYEDGSMDYVILTNTIQVLHQPLLLLREMARVGKNCIVAFPNFGHWRLRLDLLLNGRMPKSGRLPHEWYDTPNIRLLTIRDFREFCRTAGLRITREYALKRRGTGYREARVLPNMLADEAVFVIRKE